MDRGEAGELARDELDHLRAKGFQSLQGDAPRLVRTRSWLGGLLKFALLGLLVVAAGVISGCGDDASSLPTAKDRASVRGAVEKCLIRHGAKKATVPAELDFVSKAEAREELSKVGFAYEKKTDQVVSVWTAATFEGRTPSWIVWFAEPLDAWFDGDGDASPERVVQEGGPERYVYFVADGQQTQRQKLSSCINFGSLEEQPPVEIVTPKDRPSKR